MKPNMQIVDVRATSVAVPLEVPLRHANGCHWGRFVRLYQRLGGCPYDRDRGWPGWAPIIPNDRWADPNDGRPVAIP